jgi:hypothetical protein
MGAAKVVILNAQQFQDNLELLLGIQDNNLPSS